CLLYFNDGARVF
nr:immunoglobulin light chain junction region [Macaca mulatta]